MRADLDRHRKSCYFQNYLFLTQFPILLTFHYTQFFFIPFVLSGTWGGLELCWARKSLPRSFQDRGAVERRLSWLSSNGTLICILAHTKNTMEEFFFMGEKARWRGGILFLSEVKNIFSTRFISLNCFLSPQSPAVLQVTQPRLSSVKKPPRPLTSCSFLHVLIPPDCLCLSLLVAFLRQSKSPQELRAAATTKTEPKFQSNLQSPQTSTGKWNH